MSSFTRNTYRADSIRCPRAFGVGLALALASGAALADGAHRFVFTAYSDATGGAEVVAGRYRVALEELESRARVTDLNPSATDTNRCVAYSMTLQWQQARVACDAAVRAAEELRNAQAGMWTWLPASNSDSVAVAYANRAVVNWLSHDDAAAHKDLAKAQELSPRAAFVAQNLAALKLRGQMAQVSPSAPKS
jgi:hypothetical protein